MHHPILDILAHDSLLPLRERVRAGLGWARGVRLRAFGGFRSGAGLLSVIVPAYGVESYIEECLSSLRQQNYRDVEIIVVDDGSPDRSGRLAERIAKRDPRVRVIRQQNGGLSAARNTGAAVARGEFITFVDSDDVVDRHVFTQAIESLRASGSDFAVSPYRRMLRDGFPPAAPWIHHAHAQDRFACTLEEFPDILVNAVAWSKVYRRSFWTDSELSFPVGVLYEDQAVSTRAYAMARSFDVLSRVSINWRIREDRSSISQQVTSVRNITDHWRAVRESLSVLDEYGHVEAKQARIAQVISNNMTEFFLLIPEMTDEAWAVFVDSMRYLVDQIDDDGVWSRIDARSKVLTHLTVAGDRTTALRFLAHGWEREHYRAERRGDGLYARPDQVVDLSELPDSAFRLSPRESSLVAEVIGAERTEHSLVLSVIAYIGGLESAEEPMAIAELVPERGERAAPLPTEWSRGAAALAAHSTPYTDRSGALLRVKVPFTAFSGHAEDYRIRLTLSVGSLVRSARVARPRPHPTFDAVELGERLVVDLVSSPDGTAVLRSRRTDGYVAAWTRHGDTATLTLEGGEFSRVSLVSPMDRFGRRRREAPIRRVDGAQRATLEVEPLAPASGHGPGDWYVTAQDGNGDWHWMGVAEARADIDPDLASLRTRTTTAATLDVPAGTAVVQGPGARLTAVELATGGLRLAVEGTPVGAVHAVDGSRRVPVHVDASTGDLTLPLSIEEFGRPEVPLPSGLYRINGAGRFVIDQDLHRRLPMAVETDTQLVTVRADDWTTLVIDVDVLRPPAR
ncbi:glycosyltransferase [Agromyces sp. NPDC058110]|uniref:glycosyltransferase n=1 Tax=Agromyces sp. NPDC058110 TaxID=3346345 RepID=UPI0036DED407